MQAVMSATVPACVPYTSPGITPVNTERFKFAIDTVINLSQPHLGPISPTTVNFNRRFTPHFNLQLA